MGELMIYEKDDLKQLILQEIDQFSISEESMNLFLEKLQNLLTMDEREIKEFAEDGADVGDYQKRILKETLSFYDKLRNQSHTEIFSIYFALEFENDDESLANALKKLQEEGINREELLQESYRFQMAETGDENYSQKYAEYLLNNFFETHTAKKYASLFCKAKKRAEYDAREKGLGQLYIDKFIELVKFDRDEGYASLRAETFEKKVAEYNDEELAEVFSEKYSDEYFDRMCRVDIPEEDEPYYNDRATAYLEGYKIQKEVKIPGFADKFLELFFMTLKEDWTPQDFEENIEVVKQKVLQKMKV